jgi:hypothetical protein
MILQLGNQKHDQKITIDQSGLMADVKQENMFISKNVALL